MSSGNEKLRLQVDARNRIRQIENDIKSEKMEMQSLIDQGRLITVPTPTSNGNNINGQVKSESKPEKLYVIKVEPQKHAHKSVCVEVDRTQNVLNPLNNNKIEVKTKSEMKKNIKQEADIRIETDAVPPSAPRIGRSNSKVAIGSKRSSSGNLKNVNLSRSQRRLPKCVEPSRAKAHWDYLLDEMSWMAVDFYQETKWKKAAAKHFALACQNA